MLLSCGRDASVCGMFEVLTGSGSAVQLRQNLVRLWCDEDAFFGSAGVVLGVHDV